MSGLFGGGGTETSATLITSLRLQTSAYGQCIPLVYGRTRITGNLIWYGDFKAQKHTTSSGGKGGGGVSSSEYSYSAAVLMGLCEGPIIQIPTVWNDKDVYTGGANPDIIQTAKEELHQLSDWPGPGPWVISATHQAEWIAETQEGGAVYDGYYQLLIKGVDYTVSAGVYTLTTQPATSDIRINYTYTGDGPATLTALEQQGLSLYSGDLSQTGFPYLHTNHPEAELAYRQLAYVASGKYDLGNNASLPNHNFEVEALLPYSSTVRDANPAAVLQDFLTHFSHGAGFPADRLGSLAAWGNYCAAAGIFISPAYTEQTAAHEAVTTLARIGNAAPVYSEGKLKIVPYGDQPLSGYGATFAPDITPLYALTDDDFIDQGDGADPVVVQRGSPADAFNQVQIKYYNRANQYNEDVVTVVDQANIELYGLRPMEPITLKEICDPGVAQHVAQLILQRAIGIRNTYRFKLGWKFCLLEPMDLVTLTEGGDNGLQAVPVRITAVEEDENGLLDITAEDATPGVATGARFSTEVNESSVIYQNTPPGNANPPVIVNGPLLRTNGANQLWMAISGGENFGGCDIWASSDGATYQSIGRFTGKSRTGYLVSGVPIAMDPDTQNVPSVDLSESAGELLSGTQLDADNNVLLACFGEELISYQTATLTAANRYSLSYLRRGVYGSPIGEHAAGTRFARLDDSLFRVDVPEEWIGQTIYFKLAAFNIYGRAGQDIATLQAYTHVVNPFGVQPPTLLTLTTGNDQYVQLGDGTIVPRIMVAWVASTDPAVAEYEIQWRTNTSLPWESVIVSNTTAYAIVPVIIGESYAIRVRARSARGAVSAWLEGSITASGKSVPPHQVGDFTATYSAGLVTLSWMPLLAPDIAYYEVRVGTTWALGTTIGRALSGLTYQLTSPGTYTFWLAAVNTSGQASTPVYVTLTVSVPPPLTGISVTAGLLNGYFQCEPPVATDFSGVMIWMGTSSDFVPGSDNLVYDGPSTTVVINQTASGAPLVDGTTYYVRAAAYSLLAKTGLNISDAYSFIPTSPGGIPVYDTVAGLPPTAADGTVVSVKSTNKLYRYDTAQGWITWVDGSDILAASVTAGKISVTNLGAISANLGTITAGNITLDAAGWIKGGQTAYNVGAGFWMGYASGYFKFSLGNPSGNNLRWDGTNLSITSPQFTLASGSAAFSGAISGGTIRIGSGHSPNGKAFEVNASGAQWVDEITCGTSIFQNGWSSSTIPAISVIGVKSQPAINISNGGDSAGLMSTGTSTGSNSHAIRGYCSGGYGGIIGARNGCNFYADGSGASDYATFTGAHDCLIPLGVDLEPGDIVIDVACLARRGLSNALFAVEKSSSPCQNGASGVFVWSSGLLADQAVPAVFNSEETALDADGDLIQVMGPAYEALKNNYNLGLMNALGEGQVKVCGENGDLAVGDLVVTSSVPGVGMRQSDDHLRSCTVARAREAVTFNAPDEIRLVACIYLCG